MGGTVPIDFFIQALGMPAIGVPVVNFDNNQHSDNENLRLQNLWDAVVSFAAVLQMWRDVANRISKILHYFPNFWNHFTGAYLLRFLADFSGHLRSLPSKFRPLHNNIRVGSQGVR